MAPICDDSLCFATPTAGDGSDMHVDRKRYEAAILDSWPTQLGQIVVETV